MNKWREQGDRKHTQRHTTNKVTADASDKKVRVVVGMWTCGGRPIEVPVLDGWMDWMADVVEGTAHVPLNLTYCTISDR